MVINLIMFSRRRKPFDFFRFFCLVLTNSDSFSILCVFQKILTYNITTFIIGCHLLSLPLIKNLDMQTLFHVCSVLRNTFGHLTFHEEKNTILFSPGLIIKRLKLIKIL